jgi:hypothetical protein
LSIVRGLASLPIQLAAGVPHEWFVTCGRGVKVEPSKYELFNLSRMVAIDAPDQPQVSSKMRTANRRPPAPQPIPRAAAAVARIDIALAADRAEHVAAVPASVDERAGGVGQVPTDAPGAVQVLVLRVVAGVGEARDRRVIRAAVVGDTCEVGGDHRHRFVVQQLRREVGLDELHEVERGELRELGRIDAQSEGADRVDVLAHFERVRAERRFLPAVRAPLRRGVARGAAFAPSGPSISAGANSIAAELSFSSESYTSTYTSIAPPLASSIERASAGCSFCHARGTPTQRTKSSAASSSSAPGGSATLTQ